MAKAVKDPMDAVIANIEKQMGNKGRSYLCRFGDIKTESVPVISFGLKAIDDASYCSGIPRGKMVELFGPESSGKSLLSLYLIADAQKQGLECALLDIEQSFDPVWAKKHGVNVEKLFYCNTFDSGEQALEYSYQMCKSGSFGLVVIDSTAALTPLSELEGSLEDNARVGAQALLLSRGCRKIRGACGTANTTCIFINQIREKIGVMWGNPETTPGGRALKFYSDVRLRTQGKSKIKVKQSDGVEVVVGQVSEVVFVKNRVARPFGRAEFRIIYDSCSMNPVVMLCNEARAAKLIKPRNGLFRLQPEVTGTLVEMGATTIPEVADYLVKNNLVIALLDKVVDERGNDPTATPLDDAILDMKNNPKLIVSPTLGDIILNADKVEDADPKELEADLKEEAPEPEQ